MSNRRFFLKALAATLLPLGPNLACAAILSRTKQTVPPVLLPAWKKEPESLPHFISRYLKSTDWTMDKNQAIGIEMSGASVENGYWVANDIHNAALRINLPTHLDHKACVAFEILLERRLAVYQDRSKDRPEVVVWLQDCVIRSKLASFTFPAPGLVTFILTPRFDMGAPGRFIGIARFEANSGQKLPTTLVAVSPEVRHYRMLQDSKWGIDSYNRKISACKHERGAAQSAPVRPENNPAWGCACVESMKNKL